jgi:hypothetical protein
MDEILEFVVVAVLLVGMVEFAWLVWLLFFARRDTGE